MDITTIVTLSSIGLFAIVAIVGFIRGFFKGTFRSLTDVGFVLLNAVISIFIAEAIAGAIVDPENIYSALESINGGAQEGALAEIMGSMEAYINDGFFERANLDLVFAIFVTVLVPIIYMAVYLIIGIIFKIVKTIIQKCFIPKSKKVWQKLLGGFFGIVRSVLALAIFLVPLVGFATYGVNTIGKVNETIESDSGEAVVTGVSEFEEIVDGGAFGAISTCGGQWLFEVLTTTDVDDVEVSLVDETDNVLNIYKSIVPLTEIDSAEFTSKETQLVDNAINEISKSEYLTALIANLLSQTATELKEHDKFFTFELPSFGESFDPVVDKLLEVMSGMTGKGLVTDLRTYSSIFKTTVNRGLFRELNSENGDIYKVLEDGKFYSEILVSLYVNPNTRPTVPTVANAMQSYLYEVYEEINGEPYGEIIKVDEGKINQGSLDQEGARIALAIKEIRIFSDTIADIEYVDDIVKAGDFVALGTGLNQIRDSIFFGNSYKFLLDSILHSEACAKLGIFDSNFVENATKPGVDMVQLLVSRQKLATLTMAIWDGDKALQEDHLAALIAEFGKYEKDDPNARLEAEALMELAQLENLNRYGVKGEKGETVSSISQSLVDTIYNHEYEDENGDGSVEDEKADEAAKTAHILTTIASAHDSTSENLFDNGTGDSKTGETAEQLISNILDSSIATEMIGNAVENNSEDPYGIQSELTDSDKSSLQAALENEYATGANRTAVLNIATVFGITLGE